MATGTENQVLTRQMDVDQTHLTDYRDVLR